MNDLFVIDGLRTPFCRAGSDLSTLDVTDLGRHVCSALLTRTAIDPGELAEVVFGCVAQPAEAANPARVIALRAGVPRHVPAATVQRNCASGMEAITTAHQRMATGVGDLFLVGGVESMSNIPFYYQRTTAEKLTNLARARSIPQRIRAALALRPSDFKPRIGLELGLTDPFSGMIMGDTAELLAREYGIDRETQDAFAASSHDKALAAREWLAEEISPVPVDGKPVEIDNGVRDDSTPGKLATLRPIFDRLTGSITAGNSSQITDGAVALLVGSEAAATRLGIEPLARLAAYTYTGCDPARMGLGPVHAVAALRERHKIDPEAADIVEINEAFAAQVLAVLDGFREPERHGIDVPPFPVDPDKLNRQGGAIALGHPVGASGARLVLTALRQLRRIGGRHALTTLCIGGGQGAALWFERP